MPLPITAMRIRFLWAALVLGAHFQNRPRLNFCQSFIVDKYLTKDRLREYAQTVSLRRPVHYPIRAVAKLTGLSIDTLRAWERRYQAVTPQRGERGRVYEEGHIRRLLLLRDLVDRGHAIGQVAHLSDGELERLLAGPPAAEGFTKPEAKGLAGVDGLKPLVAAIDQFDGAGANIRLGRLAVLLPADELVGKVVLPLMRLVGDRWQNGTLSIAQEHMTSAMMRNLLGGLVRLHTPSAGQARILFATPVGELHEFGILAAAMLAVAGGFEPVYLGPDLPGREIVAAAQRTSAAAVILGVKAAEPASETIADIRWVASELPKRTELWLGGDAPNKALSGVRRARTFALENFDELAVQLARLKESAG